MALTVASQKTIHETHQVAEDGAVDADGHILEPPTLWEEYIDPKFRDRALMFKLDEKGLEELWYDGKVSELSRRGFPATLGAMGAPDLVDMAKNPARTYLGEAPYGSMDPQGAHRRARRRAHRHGDPLHDRRPAVGGRDQGSRAVAGLLHGLQPLDLRVLRRRAAPRSRPPTSRSPTSTRRPRSSSGPSARAPRAATSPRSATSAGRSATPTTTRIFAAAQDLDVPLAIHPTFEPASNKGDRMGADNFRNLRLLSSVAGSDGVRHQFTTLFDYGVFDKFPRLKVLVLECGAGWVGYWLDRIDAVFSHTVIGERVPLTQKPSDYFRERVWISADPDERMIPALAQRYGVERFLWASDFPHADHTPEYIHDLNELVAVVPGGPAGRVHRRQRPPAVQARRPVHVAVAASTRSRQDRGPARLSIAGSSAGSVEGCPDCDSPISPCSKGARNQLRLDRLGRPLARARTARRPRHRRAPPR